MPARQLPSRSSDRGGIRRSAKGTIALPGRHRQTWMKLTSISHSTIERLTMTSTKPGTSKRTSKSAPNPIESMLRLVSCTQLSRGTDGRPFARVPVEDRFEFYELKSAAFRNWLVDAYIDRCGEPPSKLAISRVVAVLEARAQFRGNDPGGPLRVAGAKQLAMFSISTWAIMRAGRSRFAHRAGRSFNIPVFISAGRPVCCRSRCLNPAGQSTCSDRTSTWASSIFASLSPGSPRPFDPMVLILRSCFTANKVRRRPRWRGSPGS